jgi:pleiotropic regulator 1
VANHGMRPQDIEAARKLRMSVKTRDEFWAVKDLPPPPGAAAAKPEDADDAAAKAHLKQKAVKDVHEQEAKAAAGPAGEVAAGAPAGQLAVYKPQGGTAHGSTALMVRAGKTLNMPKPEWHAPWKLKTVISGHLGWVRCICVEPGNEWFATGAGDRTVKIWDLASGDLKLTLTGHISPVRGIAVSDRHPYMFTVGEDKLVKCWDLETNKVMRHYHGHLSGVYSCALHPTLDVLCTGGRDSAVRVWDIRSLLSPPLCPSPSFPPVLSLPPSPYSPDLICHCAEFVHVNAQASSLPSPPRPLLTHSYAAPAPTLLTSMSLPGPDTYMATILLQE